MEGDAGIDGLVLGGGEYCCVGVVSGKVAPHFQQTDNVGGLPVPHLGQMVLLDKSDYCLHNLSSSSLEGSIYSRSLQ